MAWGGERDLKVLLSRMAPQLSHRQWTFQPISDLGSLPEDAFALIREEEGLCCILPGAAMKPDAPTFAKITLQVHSDLEAVGLTAAVATALASSQIPCNVVAGLRHDHIFVPWNSRHQALDLLERLRIDAA